MQIYSLASPGNPSPVAAIPTSGSAVGLDVAGTTLAVTQQSPTALQMFTLAGNGLSATARGSVTSLGIPNGVLIEADRVLVADHKFGFRLVDSSNIDSPFVIETLDSMGWAPSLTRVSPGLIAGGDGVGGVYMMRPSSSDLPPQGGSIDFVPTVRVVESATDPEGAPVTYVYEWSNGSGKLVAHGPTARLTDTLVESELIVPEETWTATVTPYANGIAGNPLVSTIKFISTSPTGWVIR